MGHNSILGLGNGIQEKAFHFQSYLCEVRLEKNQTKCIFFLDRIYVFVFFFHVSRSPHPAFCVNVPQIFLNLVKINKIVPLQSKAFIIENQSNRYYDRIKLTRMYNLDW